MHQYRIQYQKAASVMMLAEVVVHTNVEKSDFVRSLALLGYWMDDKTWIAPGCIQDVVVIA